MSLPQVEKFLFQVANDPLRRALYEQDVTKLLEEYDLTDAETRAIKDIDITSLFSMTIEPLLIQPFAAIHNIHGPDLFALCKKAGNWDNRAALGLDQEDV